MKLGISYEQALAKARPGLRYRMEQSVSLIRKAEALALRYDADNGFFLAFSGGKDSQALYHIVQLAGVRFQAHFSPTTVDPPQVIRFIRRNYQDVIFEKVDKSMFQVAKEMGMVPTMKLRWCCAKFKETAGAGRVTLTGIRRAESIKRAKRQSVEVSGHKFSGNLDEFMGWSKERIEKKVKNLNLDEFSRDKEQEIRCINGKDSIIVNPMLEWTDRDVWDFLNDVCQVPHCELYDPPYNQHRIGCILCPMSSHRQKLKDCQMYPHIKRKWLEVFEYFIGGGTLQSTETNREVFTSRGGGESIIGSTASGTDKWRNNSATPNVPRPGKVYTPGGAKNKKRKAQMGKSRGKYVGTSPVRLVAYARYLGRVQGKERIAIAF